MQQRTLINLTDTPVTFYNDEGVVILVIPPYSVPAVCLLTHEFSERNVDSLFVNNVEIPISVYSNTIHLPEPAPDIGYIVPNGVLEAIGEFERDDVFSPDWLTAVNDVDGVPIGVHGLTVFGSSASPVGLLPTLKDRVSTLEVPDDSSN